MIAVCVTFTLVPGLLAEFLAPMRKQAEDSLKGEPGCHRFDICHGGDRSDVVFLYELYEDRAAFDLHLQSRHFLDFDARVGPMVAEKSVAIFDTVTIGAGA